MPAVQPLRRFETAAQIEEDIMIDRDLKQHVENALDWEPSVDATDIGVSVNEGVVTLRGNVAAFTQKVAAERVALRVYGVKAVANELVVQMAGLHQRTDTEIAHAAVNALSWHTLVPADRVTLRVEDACITLVGTVDWQYQKDAAGRAVRDLHGIIAVTNNIVVHPRMTTIDVRDQIEAAFKRSAAIDARRVNVTAADGNVILSGNVHSWMERQEAERAAWAAPGVRRVDDRLTVVP
jgi:osmotically-inducible protein OsmY